MLTLACICSTWSALIGCLSESQRLEHEVDGDEGSWALVILTVAFLASILGIVVSATLGL